MNEKLAEFAIETLQKSFNSSFNSVGMTKIKADLLREPDKAMQTATDYFILHSRFLPTPAMLLAKVQEEGKKIAIEEQRIRAEAAREAVERAERERKEKEYLEASVLTRKYGEPLGKAWHDLMEMVLADPKVPWPTIITKAREFDSNFPGLGFDALADEWEAEHG